MAANEIVLKDIMTDCHETEELLKQLQQEKETWYAKGQAYYEKNNSHPPVLLREYIESADRVDVLQTQLDRLQALSKEIAPDYQACQTWLDNAKQGRFQCEMNLFKQPHTARDLGKENNVIAVTAQSTTLKFVYADDNTAVVDNGYVFYWVYDDKDTDAIEDEDYMEFTSIARPMLPVGVGRTDKDGYLRKSMFFEQNTFSHIQTDQKHCLQLNLKPDYRLGNLKIKSGKTLSETIQENMTHWNKMGQLQGSSPFYLEHSKANRGHFDRELSAVDRNLQDLYAFHLSQDDFEKASALIKNIKWDKQKDFIKRVSNQYFYLFKPYGFMCYPIDRGSFSTKDLKELTTKNDHGFSVAWKGYLNPGRTNPPEMTIPIHCTLPEWDRRIQRQLYRLKKALDVHLTNQQPHQKVMSHLDGMLQSALIHRRFSVDIPENEAEKAKYDALIQNLQSVQASIEDAQNGDQDPDNPISMKKELEDVEVQAIQLRTMLNSEALLAEFKRYWRDGPEENDGVLKAGPDMEEEPYWVHFFHTYCEAIMVLRNTPLGMTIFNEEISPFLDQLVAGTDFTELAPGEAAEDLINKTDEFFAGQSEEGSELDDEENIVKKRLLSRVQEINDTESNEENAEDENQQQDTLLYVMLKGWRDSAGTLFHRVPGPPSVLQVILDVYADHISKKIQRESLSKGAYHIKLMMVICDFFGVFGEEKFKKNRDFLYTALRAHGRLHRKGGSSPSGSKNYYSHSALEARMQLLAGTFTETLSKQQKKDLEAVMASVGGVKKFIQDNFSRRPFPGFAANMNKGSSFSDTVYTANNHFAYKGIMAIVNLGFMVESWINLPKEKTAHWDEGEHLRYIATLTDTLGATTLMAYQTSRLVTRFKLAPLVDKMEQAKNNSRFLWTKADTELEKMAPFMDNLAVSLSLLTAVKATVDGFQYSERGQNEKAMVQWFDATAASMVAYGFYAGKYTQKGVFAYLSGKVVSRTGSLLSRAGIALFLPFIGEAVAVAGAVLSVLMVVYDVAEMIVDYHQSTLLLQFDFHYKQLARLDKKNYFKLNSGQLETSFKAIGDYDGFLWHDLRFNHLHLNALVPLRSLGHSLEAIRDMLDYNDYRLINELIILSERVNDAELSGHYYQRGETIEAFPVIAKRLSKGTFFDTQLTPYQQRQRVLTHYARYREYPRP